MKYPKYYIYEQLYKRYFIKEVDYLIKKANIINEDNILDICSIDSNTF